MLFAFKILQNYELSPKSYAFNNSLTTIYYLWAKQFQADNRVHYQSHKKLCNSIN